MILRKIIKIAATRCHNLKLKCTKFDFGWGSAPDPAVEAYSTPQTPLLDLRGLLLREGRGGYGRVGEGRGQGRAGEGSERRGDGGKGKGKGEIRDRGRGGSGRRMGFTHPLFSA